ncbi:MAG: OmpA family protein [Nitrospirae bacterium]|nr:OmpA family protein [Nitrospirota bacterium]MBF0540308.1 OmpA family protein [Nitrospirota bacterium]
MKLLLALLSIVLLTTGCASNKVTVCLLHEEGKTSSIEVYNKNGSQVIDKENYLTTVSGTEASPIKPEPVSQKYIDTLYESALKALPTAPDKFILYFESNSSEIVAESQPKLPLIVESIKKRESVDVSIIGHTDTVGTPKLNYELSLDRAKTVSDYLLKNGIDKNILHIEYHGKENPLIPTGDNVDEPRNRRVEVIIR